MRTRKLQVFISSTYEDLIEERLAAFEAVLAAGHVPAAMEQFTPGDETAWTKIQSWIDESDAFILILGGRYGSLEPESGTGYVELEYDYAHARGKPFFSMVVKPEHHEVRVKSKGLGLVDERTHPEKYRAFRDRVQTRLCAFWSDRRDIQNAIFRKLPEWVQREELKGWVRADETASPILAEELARLSEENRKLREALDRHQDRDFEGLTFDQLVRRLKEERVSVRDDLVAASSGSRDPVVHAGHLFESFKEVFAVGAPALDQFAYPLMKFGLVERGPDRRFALTEAGRRFRNRLESLGAEAERRTRIWALDEPPS